MQEPEKNTGRNVPREQNNVHAPFCHASISSRFWKLMKRGELGRGVSIWHQGMKMNSSLQPSTVFLSSARQSTFVFANAKYCRLFRYEYASLKTPKSVVSHWSWNGCPANYSNPGIQRWQLKSHYKFCLLPRKGSNSAGEREFRPLQITAKDI